MRAPMTDLLSCARRLEPALQFPDGRRQDENADEIVARFFAQLLRALPIDIEQHVAAGAQCVDDRPARRAVAMAEHFGPLQQLAFFDHGIEATAIDEMIIAAVDLAGPLAAGGHRHR